MPINNSPERPLAICLMGPTASGKTDLAIKLVQTLPCDIISVDSALVYRDLDIGSAKPTVQEQREAPHRLIDIRNPADSYSAADFARDARIEMDAIAAAGRIPLLVGGTMLYFKALLEGFADMPATDLAIRAGIEADAEARGWPALHLELMAVDPESATRIHPNHSQRIERALNIYRNTGETMTSFHQKQQDSELPFNVLQLAICPRERAVLHQRIEKRFRRMMEQGFLDEVRALHGRADLHLDLPSMRAVGYRQAWQYLDGDLEYEEMIERGVIATRQLAKRQLTWLRGWQGVHWLHTDADNRLISSPETAAQLGELEGRSPKELALRYLDEYLDNFSH